MNHAEVEATGAVERYLVKDMNEADALQFEEHYFSCAECAEDVRVSAIFLANLRAVLSEPYAVTRDADRETSNQPRGRAWLAPLSIAAAVLLSLPIGYQNAVQIPRLRHEVEMAKTIESPPVYELLATRSGSGESVVVSRETRRVALLLNNIPGRTYPYYECALGDENDRIVRTFRVKVMIGREQWEVPLAVDGLSSQRYTLRVRGAPDSSGPATQDAGEYRFKLEIRQ